jgi:import inner membrane translocase subunit TIM44
MGSVLVLLSAFHICAPQVWDSVTRETDQGIAIRELRRLDPAFTLEEWTEVKLGKVCAAAGRVRSPSSWPLMLFCIQDVMENLVPTILEAHVKGNTRVLKKWTGEALYNKLNAEITQRKSEGIQLDEHILAIEEANVINVAYEEGAGQSPIIVLQFMVQQIHCIRKNGEIVEVSMAAPIVSSFVYVMLVVGARADDYKMRSNC